MIPPAFENRGQLKTPEEELARLRGETAQRHLEAEQRGEQKSEQAAAKEALLNYAATKPQETLHPDYALKSHEANEIVLELSPEPHDKQIEGLISILQEKGIRNALHVVEKMNSPHLYDDFHRFLVQFIASGYPITGLKEKDDLWKPLHMTLFEVSLPEAVEDGKQKQMSELISGMEQFYAGMLSISGDKKAPAWFSMEIANSNGSEQFVFYVSVPSVRKGLFEKQILAVFPKARIHEHKDDYNIFNPQGASAASYASLSKQPLYPLKSYEEFDVDPLNSILNAFSKIDRDGEGAAIQLIVNQRQDSYAKECSSALEKIRKGKKIGHALDEVGQSAIGAFSKELFGAFKKQETVEKEKEEEAKRAQALDQSAIEQFTRKLSSPFISVNLRIAVSAATEAEARNILSDIESSFNQFEHGHGNRIEWKKVEKKKLEEVLEQFSLRAFDEKESVILNLEEMTTILHFPSTASHGTAPQLKQSASGTAPAPIDLPQEGTLLGVNVDRSRETKVYITDEDRLRHFYVIGQTGTGKTTLLKNMILQDMQKGNGVCFIDPHGSDVQDILSLVPSNRFDDVVYFDPAYTARPMGLNMLEYDARYPEQKTFVVNEMLSIFNKLFDMKTAGGPMFEQYFRNSVLLAIDDPSTGNTLIDVSRVLSNKAFRDMKLSHCANPLVVQFWKEVAEKAGGEASLANIVPYIVSKFDNFLANDIMRPVIAQEKSTFNFRDIMDNKKILLVNLSKGRLGDINANLIGLVLVGKILMAALSRVDSIGNPPFYLYIDEFQNITTDSIATILSEARKYKLSLNIAHQFIKQLDEKIKNAVFGNVGSMAVFRVGAEDSEFLVKQFEPVFTEKDIINIDNYSCYMKMLANGKPVKPFNISTPNIPKGDRAVAEKLKELSYLTYGKAREEIEGEIAKKYR